MRILNVFCLLLIISICAGCGDTYWYKENNQYSRASIECLDCLAEAQRDILGEAVREGRNLDASSAANDPYERKLFEKCMKEKGYRQVPGINLDYSIRKGFVKNRDEQYFIAGQ